MPRIEVSPGFLLLMGLLFWLDEGVGLLPWGLLACGLHELGHAAAAAVWGGHVRRLSLTVVGAELRIDYDAPLAYGPDSMVALAGPGVNLLSGVLALSLGWELAGVVSLTIGGFNLLPIPPLDGGSIRLAGGPAGHRLGGAAHDCHVRLPGGGAGRCGGVGRRPLWQRDVAAYGLVAAGWRTAQGKRTDMNFCAENGKSPCKSDEAVVNYLSLK